MRRKTYRLILAMALFPLSGRAECQYPARPPPTTQAEAPPPTSTLERIVGRIVEMLAKQQYRVITFGDSIMFGWSETQLAQALGGPVLNAAVGGGTQTLIWQLQTTNFGGQAPEDVVLVIGTNNIGDASCNVFFGIQAAVAAVKAHFPSTRIFVVSILPRGMNLLDYNSKILSVNNMLRAAQGDLYTFVDAHDAFECSRDIPCKFFQEGNLHLSQTGYGVLTQILRDVATGISP